MKKTVILMILILTIALLSGSALASSSTGHYRPGYDSAYSSSGSSPCYSPSGTETIKGKPATCTETGLTDGKRCADCGRILVAQQIIPPTGHRTVVEEPVEPTCTTSGLTVGSYCPDCGEVYGEQQVIPALGHDEVIDKAVAATCTESGLTEGKHCARCEEVLIQQNVTPALSHWFGLWSPTEKGMHTATCLRDGCGYVGTKDCAPIETALTGKIVSVCPVCGRSGDKVYEIIEGAEITEVDRFAIKRGETVIRGMEAPTEGVLYAFTVGQEYSGVIEPFQGTIKVQIPLDASIQNFELKQIPTLKGAATSVSVQYTIEDGMLTFETHTPGLFLLVAKAA